MGRWDTFQYLAAELPRLFVPSLHLLWSVPCVFPKWCIPSWSWFALSPVPGRDASRAMCVLWLMAAPGAQQRHQGRGKPRGIQQWLGTEESPRPSWGNAIISSGACSPSCQDLGSIGPQRWPLLNYYPRNCFPTIVLEDSPFQRRFSVPSSPGISPLIIPVIVCLVIILGSNSKSQQ